MIAHAAITELVEIDITVDEGVDTARLGTAARGETPHDELRRLVSTASGALKLERVVPDALIEQIMIRRFMDTRAVTAVANAPIDSSEAPESA
jgi:hypothetical protein